MTLSEFREMPEARKISRLLFLAAAVWMAFLFLVLEIRDMGREIDRDLSAGDQIINNAIVYRSYPATARTKTAATTTEEPLTVLSQIVDALELRERMLQLQSNASGILLQLDKLYGEELEEFLGTIESRGLTIKTAEIRSIPSGEERLIGATLLMEQNR